MAEKWMAEKSKEVAVSPLSAGSIGEGTGKRKEIPAGRRRRFALDHGLSIPARVE
jgi:hypothetical protein